MLRTNLRKVKSKIRKKNTLILRNYFLKNFFSFSKKYLKKKRKKIPTLQKHYYKKFIGKGKKKYTFFLNLKKLNYYKNRGKRWLFSSRRKRGFDYKERNVPAKSPRKLLLSHYTSGNKYHGFL